jgi:hypothetical protein
MDDSRSHSGIESAIQHTQRQSHSKIKFLIYNQENNKYLSVQISSVVDKKYPNAQGIRF